MAITSISLQAHPRQMAKPETVGKVCAIVKKQLSLDDTKKVNAETKFVDLGADSLDTVEIVMRLEEEFGIEMAEEKAQTITTIEQAAELIEEMLMDKANAELFKLDLEFSLILKINGNDLIRCKIGDGNDDN